jgi:hypothetical protein
MEYMFCTQKTKVDDEFEKDVNKIAERGWEIHSFQVLGNQMVILFQKQIKNIL